MITPRGQKLQGNIFDRIGGGDKNMSQHSPTNYGAPMQPQQGASPLVGLGTDVAKGAALKYGLPAAKSALGGIFGAGGAAAVAGTGAAGAGGASTALMGAGATTAIAPTAAGAAGGGGMLAAMGPVGWGIAGAAALGLGAKKLGWL